MQSKNRTITFEFNSGRALLAGLILLFSVSRAWALEVYSWRAIQGFPPLLIAVRDGEDAKSAADRYIRMISEDQGLKSLLAGRALHLDVNGEMARFDQSGQKHNVLLIANDPDDYQPRQTYRVPSFMRVYSSASEGNYLLPLAHDIGLSEAEAEEFRSKIYRGIELAIGMGGADVHPSIYGDNFDQGNGVNLTRDLAEARFVRGYLAQIQRRQAGHFVGICRGAQLTGAMLGYKMIKDIPTQVGNQVHHSRGALHDLKIQDVAGSWVRALFGGADQGVVNSWHHQAVDLSSNPIGSLVPTAYAADGVAEAYQTLDGRVLLMQFHPELMYMNPETEVTGRKMLESFLKLNQADSAVAHGAEVTCKAFFR